MMKTTYVIFFCLLIHILHAEQTKPIKSATANKKLFVGINFSPGVAFRTLRQTVHSYEEDMVYRTDNNLDRPMFGFDAGLNLNYLFTKNVGVETGLEYSQMGFQSKWYPISFAQPTVNGSDFNFKYIDQFHYILVPIKTKISAGKGKLKFVGGAGFLFDFLIGTTSKGTLISYSNGANINSINNSFPAKSAYNVFSMSGTLSAGLDYKINDLMGIRVEPLFSHQFIKLNASGPIYHYLWSAGVNMAYYFGVK